MRQLSGPLKRYYMQGTILLFIGERTTSYEITCVPIETIHVIYTKREGNIVFRI
jgi:hypothetical protein